MTLENRREVTFGNIEGLWTHCNLELRNAAAAQRMSEVEKIAEEQNNVIV